MEKNNTNIESVPNKTSENKVKILSQTLLQAASLTSKREFLNRVLQNSASKIKILNQARKENVINNQEDKKTILSNKNNPGKKQENTHPSEDNTSHDGISSPAKNKNFNYLSSSDSNSGQMQFIEGIKKMKEMKSNSDEGSSADDNTNKDKSIERKMEILSDSSSSAEFEKQIRKTQISKLDIPTPETHTIGSKSNTGENNIKIKQKKLEFLSESSDVEHESENIDNIKKNFTKQNKLRKSNQKRVKSESSRSESEDDNSVAVRKKKYHKKKNAIRDIKHVSSTSFESENDNKLSLLKEKQVLSSKDSKNILKSDSYTRTDFTKDDKEGIGDNAKNKYSNKNNIKGSQKSKYMSESSSSDSEDDSSKDNEKIKTSNSEQHKNTLKKAELSSMDSESDSSSSARSTRKSDSTSSDSETSISKGDMKKRISSSSKSKFADESNNLEGKSKSKHHKSESSSTDSTDDSVKGNTKSNIFENKEHANTVKQSEMSRLDSSSSHKSQSSSSDSETDSSEHDKKGISNKSEKKYNIKGKPKSKHPKSDSSSSDSEDDSTRGNRKMNICGDSEGKIKGKKYVPKSKISDTDTDSSTSNASISSIKNKTSRKRKHSEIKSSDDESGEIFNKKRKRPADFQNPESESAKLLQSFAESNEYSQVLPKKRENLTNMLDNNDEVYLVQLPKCINPRLLADKTVSFDRPTKVKLENESYIWNVNHEYKHDACIVDFNNLLKIRLNGVIILQQHFSSRSKSVEVEPIHDIEDVPNNLKVRHPLFGTDYQEKIELDADILAKLAEISATVNKRRKKKSKKKHKKEIEDERPENLDIFKLLNEHEKQKKEDDYEVKTGATKKHKKHKSKWESETHEAENEIHSIISEMFPEVQKNKKKKEHSSETSINYDRSKSKDKRKHKSSLTDTNKSNETQLSMPTIDYEGIRENSKDENHQKSLSESPSGKHKKKKKRKSSLSLNDSMISTSVVDDSNVQVESERKDKHSFDISASNLSECDSKRHKKKKKKNRSTDQIVNSTMSTSVVGNIFELDESCIPKVKKKKKKHDKYRNSIDNFVDDLVKTITSSDETQIIEKKKSKRSY